jgi:8-oxo-dGTP pyrophosphatase MutT (NUDIX family)
MKKAAVVRLINEKGEMLFLLRATKPFGWGLPGGKIDDGENSREAATRELEEETGILMSGMTLTFVGTTKSYNDMDVDVYEGYWDTSLSTAAPIKLSPREHLSYRWVSSTQGLVFAGNTEHFVELGKPIHVPETIDAMTDRFLLGVALEYLENNSDEMENN